VTLKDLKKEARCDGTLAVELIVTLAVAVEVEKADELEVFELDAKESTDVDEPPSGANLKMDCLGQVVSIISNAY